MAVTARSVTPSSIPEKQEYLDALNIASDRWISRALNPYIQCYSRMLGRRAKILKAAEAAEKFEIDLFVGVGGAFTGTLSSAVVAKVINDAGKTILKEIANRLFVTSISSITGFSNYWNRATAIRFTTGKLMSLLLASAMTTRNGGSKSNGLGSVHVPSPLINSDINANDAAAVLSGLTANFVEIKNIAAQLVLNTGFNKNISQQTLNGILYCLWRSAIMFPPNDIIIFNSDHEKKMLLASFMINVVDSARFQTLSEYSTANAPGFTFEKYSTNAPRVLHEERIPPGTLPREEPAHVTSYLAGTYSGSKQIETMRYGYHTDKQIVELSKEVAGMTVPIGASMPPVLTIGDFEHRATLLAKANKILESLASQNGPMLNMFGGHVSGISGIQREM